MKRTKFLEAVLDKMPFLSELEDKEAFFRRVAAYIPPLDPGYRMIEKAHSIIEEVFEDKEIARETGDNFSVHVRATCLIGLEYLRIKNPIVNSVALLHDIVEKTFWTIERVHAEFGYEHALLLSYLSKPTAEEFPSFSAKQILRVYFDRFAFAPREFWEVKLPDNFHNLITMWNSSPEKMARKAEETKKYYLPYAEKHLILLHELEAAVESIEEELKTLKEKTS